MILLLDLGGRSPLPQTKKADVAKHPQMLNHVGLLFDEPPGVAGLPFV